MIRGVSSLVQFSFGLSVPLRYLMLQPQIPGTRDILTIEFPKEN